MSELDADWSLATRPVQRLFVARKVALLLKGVMVEFCYYWLLRNQTLAFYVCHHYLSEDRLSFIELSLQMTIAGRYTEVHTYLYYIHREGGII